MARELSEAERMVRDGIKRVAKRANEANKIFSDVKTAMLYEKQAFLVLNKEAEKKFDEFKRIVLIKLQETYSKLDRLEGAYTIFGEEAKSIERQINFQYEQETKNEVYGRRNENLLSFLANFGAVGADSMEVIKNAPGEIAHIKENLGYLVRFLSSEQDFAKRANSITSVFNHTYNMISTMHNITRGLMTRILMYYTGQARLYLPKPSK